MLTDLASSAEARTARIAAVTIALSNGLSPVLIVVAIMAPLWIAQAGMPLPVSPLLTAIGMAFLCVFLLGTLLGKIGGTFWLWSGLKAVLVAGATVAVIFLLES